MSNIKKEQAYQFFNTFVFRTPYFCFEEFEETVKKLETDESYWHEFLQNKSLQEAIFLGTPVLYDEIQKFIAGTLTNPKEVTRLKLSVLRYYTRMSTRCTPFGLFAGFSLGNFGEKTEVELAEPDKYSRYTRLDMNYLCGLAQDLGKIPSVRKHLKYYPNNSWYPLGEKIRYVEYFFQNARRIHNIAAVDNSDYLNDILTKASLGSTIDELAVLLVDDDISLEEATDFINELIDSQLLISEMEPAVTGKDFLIQLSSIVQTVPEIEEQKEKLTKIAVLLSEIDAGKIGETQQLYSAIEEIVKEIGTAYEAKFLFQTDMFKPVKKSVLDKNISQSVQEALELMNKLTLPPPETLLTKFAENYYDRYEDKEMPLLEVLDTENGIGYQQSAGDINPLLDGYFLPMMQSGNQEIRWNRIQSVLHKKFLNAYKTNAYNVEIEEKDFDFLLSNWNDQPVTISCMCKIFAGKEEPLIYINNAGGSSAANLLGRFCHVNKELENYVIDITKLEQEQNSDAIYAEIVHLPESRIGNILLRPVLRAYEIPYLGKSSVENEFQIPLSDLYISAKRGKIVLRSKRLGKEIIPRLSTAHNYSFKSMPVYHFLCDMQLQSLRGGVGFHWGSLANEYDFLPRVTYKNTVISLAKWTIKTEDFNKIMERNNKEKGKENISLHLSESIMQNLKNWQKEKQIPRFVMLPDGDNELFVDMENSLSIQTLISAIKKRPTFQLEEFPFDKENGIVTNPSGLAFTNEFIFGFYKSKKHE